MAGCWCILYIVNVFPCIKMITLNWDISNKIRKILNLCINVIYLSVDSYLHLF